MLFSRMSVCHLHYSLPALNRMSSPINTIDKANRALFSPWLSLLLRLIDKLAAKPRVPRPTANLIFHSPDSNAFRLHVDSINRIAVIRESKRSQLRICCIRLDG